MTQIIQYAHSDSSEIGESGFDHHMMDGFFHHGFSMGYGYIILMFILVISLLLFIIPLLFLIQKLLRKDKLPQNEHNQVSILKKRYAKGEISKNEYEEMKKVIED